MTGRNPGHRNPAAATPFSSGQQWKQMTIILMPSNVAEDCFLAEALDWVAFHRYPIEMITENNVDGRFDPEYNEEYEASTQYFDVITSDECRRVGLPPNPSYESQIAGDYNLRPEDIDRLLELDLDEHERKELTEKKRRSIAHYRDVAAWEQQYDAFIEVPKTKIFLALREGRFEARGRPLPKPDLDEAIVELDKGNAWQWTDLKYQRIPDRFWRLDGINWEASSAIADPQHYMHIVVRTSQLFEVFPPPPVEKTNKVSIIAGQYVLDDEVAPNFQRTHKRGRPPYDWDMFHLEVAKVVKSDELPPKQEAFVASMQQWCSDQWGFKPGRSTILQKVSPYYRTFKSK